MGHTYTKMLFVIYLKFQSNWHPVFLSAKYGNPKSGACLLGVSASGKTQKAVRTLGCGHPDFAVCPLGEREVLASQLPWRSHVHSATCDGRGATEKARQGGNKLPHFESLHFHSHCHRSGTGSF